jgi:hypothetical protein
MKSMLVAAMLMLSAAAHAAQPLIVGGSGPVVTPLGDKAGEKAVCALGNEPDWDVDSGTYVSNHGGPESYAMLIDPATCPTCGLGVGLETVYFVLRLQAAASFQLGIEVADAIDLGGGCYSPGATQATRPPASVPSNGFAGGWIISIPWNPACLDPSRPYFVIMTFPETGSGVVGPYVDSSGVTTCRSWRNTGSGWTDVASAGFVGNMRIWTDVNCCNEPVPADDMNWGTLKTMFR